MLYFSHLHVLEKKIFGICILTGRVHSQVIMGPVAALPEVHPGSPVEGAVVELKDQSSVTVWASIIQGGVDQWAQGAMIMVKLIGHRYASLPNNPQVSVGI